MTAPLVERFCPLDASCERLLERAMRELELSARACDRIRKVARTIADLADRERIEPIDVAEAIGYRRLDRPR